jgi:menaquinone-dependent protoporphyrinogen oxidase
MKTLIAYSTTLGCTEQCASKLRKDIGEDVEMIKISSRKKYDLQEFDTIIIGGSIQEGRIQQSVHHFCTSHLQVLLQKQVGLFVCCQDQDDNEKELIEQAFPPQLVKHALASGFFGGELNIKKMNLLQKIMTRKAARLQKEPDIDFQRILEFARTIHELGSDDNFNGPIVHM